MTFCPSSAIESAVAIEHPQDKATYYFCPLVINQMLAAFSEIDFTIGILEPSLILAPKNCSPNLCATAVAILRNHELSNVNIVDFGGHLPTDTGQAAADDPENAFTTRAIHRKR